MRVKRSVIVAYEHMSMRACLYLRVVERTQLVPGVEMGGGIGVPARFILVASTLFTPDWIAMLIRFASDSAP